MLKRKFHHGGIKPIANRFVFINQDHPLRFHPAPDRRREPRGIRVIRFRQKQLWETPSGCKLLGTVSPSMTGHTSAAGSNTHH